MDSIIFTVRDGGGGLICEIKLPMQERELKMQGGGRNCGILRYIVQNIIQCILIYLSIHMHTCTESNGLRNREVVRQYRKRKHIELMEYTEKNSDDPGRFGELICLLTPLFEVSTEVTEQLRLEQFVHEGEARIDALLLMSMISGNEDMPAETY